MIGVLETEVLSSLRDLREAPAGDVRKALEQRGTRVAYTTVATILSRLFEKGLVRRRRETCRGGERYVTGPPKWSRNISSISLRGSWPCSGPRE